MNQERQAALSVNILSFQSLYPFLKMITVLYKLSKNMTPQNLRQLRLIPNQFFSFSFSFIFIMDESDTAKLQLRAEGDRQ
jgi:hypothetical protein